MRATSQPIWRFRASDNRRTTSTALIALHNSEQWIVGAIKNCCDFDRVLVADDGSTDYSEAIATEYGRLSSADFSRPTCSVFGHNHLGQTKTKIKLLQYATGDAICFADADDYRIVDTIDTQLGLIQAGADVAIAPVYRESNKTLIASPGDPWTMLYLANFASIGILFRRSSVLDLLEDMDNAEEELMEGAPELQIMTGLLLQGATFAWSPTPVAWCRDRWSASQAHNSSEPVRQRCRDLLLNNAPEHIQTRLRALAAYA